MDRQKFAPSRIGINPLGAQQFSQPIGPKFFRVSPLPFDSEQRESV
jgi:hypothetical protein